MKKLLAVSTLIGLVMVIAACGDDPLGTRPSTTQDAARRQRGAGARHGANQGA